MDKFTNLKIELLDLSSLKYCPDSARRMIAMDRANAGSKWPENHNISGQTRDKYAQEEIQQKLRLIDSLAARKILVPLKKECINVGHKGLGKIVFLTSKNEIVSKYTAPYTVNNRGLADEGL